MYESQNCAVGATRFKFLCALSPAETYTHAAHTFVSSITMSHLMQPTILLLKEGTDSSQGSLTFNFFSHHSSCWWFSPTLNFARAIICSMFFTFSPSHSPLFCATGIPQLISNINACQAIGDILKTTLGPRGMDKLIHDSKRVTISNDGATIIKLLEIVHPAAKTLTDIAKSQDDEVRHDVLE
jgi:hypothetical protein